MALLTMPLAQQEAGRQNKATQLQVAAEVVQLAGATRRAYFVAVAAQESVKYFEQVKLAAEAAAELAVRPNPRWNCRYASRPNIQDIEVDVTFFFSPPQPSRFTAMTFNKTLIVALLASIAASTAMSNESLSTSPAVQAATYAGQQTRSIKSLPDADIAALLAGQGIGFAKAAELNGYPGPLHTLELAAALQLVATQVDQTMALMLMHRARARALGAELVAAEQRLDSLFASKRATDDAVDAAAREVGLLQARLRAEHLNTHLVQRTLLNAEQAHKYAVLRGYGSSGGAEGATSNPGHGARHH